MHGVFPDRDSLRLERFVKLLPAEPRPGVSQQAPYQPAQTRRVADLVALHHVPQQGHVHMVPQQPMPGRRIEPLHRRKASGFEPVQQRPFQLPVLAARQEGDRRPFRDRSALVAERFLEAEGMDQELPRPAPKRSGALRREQCGGRSGDEHLASFGVQDPPDEPLPSGHRLYPIEKPGNGCTVVVGLRKPAMVLADQHREVRGFDAGEALILEGKVRQPLPGDAPVDTFAADLMQEGGLSGAAHPDDRRDLAGKLHAAEEAAAGVCG